MSFDREKSMFGSHLVKSVISLDDGYGFYKKKPRVEIVNLDPVKLPHPMPSAAEVKKELKGIEEVSDFRNAPEPEEDPPEVEEGAVAAAVAPKKGGRPKGSTKLSPEDRVAQQKLTNEYAKAARNAAKLAREENQKKFLQAKVAEPPKAAPKTGGGEGPAEEAAPKTGGGGGGEKEKEKEEEEEVGAELKGEAKKILAKYAEASKKELTAILKDFNPDHSIGKKSAQQLYKELAEYLKFAL